MKSIISTIIIVLGIYTSSAQISTATEKFALPASLSESSGAIYFNNKLVTHNDSGGSNALYEVDLTSGLVTRTITISNATNVDWEDITQDDSSIYIGDIGNNTSGNRTDLKVYKISKSDYLSMTSVTAEVISFSYSDQSDFTAISQNTTEWDAEALVSFDVSNLILFTKDWNTEITKSYLISKTPGTYSLTPLTTTLTGAGLITGATYNELSGKLFLVGYTPPVLPTPLQPFVWECEGFIGNDVFSGTNTQTSLPASFGFEQVEAITHIDDNSYLITAEAFSVSIISDYAKVIEFSNNDMTLAVEAESVDDAIKLYPNPVTHFLHIENADFNSVEVFDMKSTLLYKGQANNINMSYFSKGIYVVKINLNNGFFETKKIIKK